MLSQESKGRKKYFIYGSLMANEKIIKTGTSAYLKDYKVAFLLKGPSRFEPSFALLQTAPGHKAWGVMVELTDQQWKNIARHEVMYQLQTVLITTAEDHQQHIVNVLMAKEISCQNSPILPSARYSQLLRKGAERFALPLEVQRYYEKCESRASSFSQRLNWMMPVVKRLTPMLGFNRAWWATSMSLGILLLGLIVSSMFYLLQTV